MDHAHAGEGRSARELGHPGRISRLASEAVKKRSGAPGGMAGALARRLSDDAHDGALPIDALADPYLITAGDGTVMRINRRADELLGGEIVGTSIGGLFASIDAQDVRMLLENPGVETSCETLRWADGREVTVAMGWDTEGADGWAAHWLVRFRRDDVVEADHGLPVVVYRCEAGDSWACRSISRKIEDLVGVTPSDWVSDPQRWLELVEPADRERLIEARLRMAATGEPMSCVYRLRTREGGAVWVRDRAALDAHGWRHGMLEDASIDQQRDEVLVRLHEAAAQEVRRLRAASDAKTLLFKAFVHDVRSAAVAGHTALQQLREDSGGNAGLPTAAPTLERVLSHLAHLSAGIMELENRSVPLGIVRVDLADVVGEVVDGIDPGDRELIIDVTPTVALIDPAAVMRILANLLGNAVRHTPAGTTIRVWTRRTNDSVVIGVEDDGPGLPDDQLDWVFEPIVRMSPEMDGLGLGLSFVRQLAQMHGGTVRVENLGTGGLSFVVALPQPH